MSSHVLDQEYVIGSSTPEMNTSVDLFDGVSGFGPFRSLKYYRFGERQNDERTYLESPTTHSRLIIPRQDGISVGANPADCYSVWPGNLLLLAPGYETVAPWEEDSISAVFEMPGVDVPYELSTNNAAFSQTREGKTEGSDSINVTLTSGHLTPLKGVMDISLRVLQAGCLLEFSSEHNLAGVILLMLRGKAMLKVGEGLSFFGSLSDFDRALVAPGQSYDLGGHSPVDGSPTTVLEICLKG